MFFFFGRSQEREKEFCKTHPFTLQICVQLAATLQQRDQPFEAGRGKETSDRRSKVWFCSGGLFGGLKGNL